MFSADNTRRGASRTASLLGTIVAAATLVVTAPDCGSAAAHPRSSSQEVKIWKIQYTAHNGAHRLAYVVLPAWYGPGANPPIPLVISPHGRGGNGRTNARFWGELPAIGSFAVVNPDGMGRRLARYSYGYPGQIDDLAKMPQFITAALPWVRIDPQRIYALGSSMGGQETLLLVARHPELLAGAAAMDSVTDLSRRYGQLPRVSCNAECFRRYGQSYGKLLQAAMRREVGGTPGQMPQRYADRSPLSLARAMADSNVPLQIWWSRKDRIVVDQLHQSHALYSRLRELAPCAPVSEYAGEWRHSVEMRWTELLPVAVSAFGLLPDRPSLPPSVAYAPDPSCAPGV